jgi:hypothetical protein
MKIYLTYIIMNNSKKIVFLINPNIYKLVFEYIKSIKNKIYNSKIIIYEETDHILIDSKTIYIFVIIYLSYNKAQQFLKFGPDCHVDDTKITDPD